MRNVMVDLETMGTRPDSAIIAIGAVEFGVEEETILPADTMNGPAGTRIPAHPKLGRSFYEVVDLQSCIDHGLKITGGTVMWWLQQSEEARKAIYSVDVPKSLYSALTEFTRFWNDCKAEHVWARGVDFDISILKTAYTQLGIKYPFKYNASRDSRTYFDAKGFTKEDEARVPVKGVAHNALDDARWEARAVLASMTGVFI